MKHIEWLPIQGPPILYKVVYTYQDDSQKITFMYEPKLIRLIIFFEKWNWEWCHYNAMRKN